MNTTLKVASVLVTLSLTSTGAFAQGSNSPASLSPRTKANLMTAMEGEAMANVKYLRYADQAEAEGNQDVAELFRNNANVEAAEHFDREANLLGFGTDAKSNLEEAMSGEYYEHTKCTSSSPRKPKLTAI